MITGTILRDAMEYPGSPAPLSLAQYEALAGPCNAALLEANCTTVRRAAMFLAQIGSESGSLRWSEELASGSAYNGRYDLGNNQPGDGPRFKGRSFIQITGRSHYLNLSRWAYGKRLVPTSDYFVTHPYDLALPAFAFLGPVWYWTVARPQLNALADAGNIYGGTLAVNGGTHALADREARWNKCLGMGNRILPTKTGMVMDSDVRAAFAKVEAELAATNKKLDNVLACFVGTDGLRHTVERTVAHVTQGMSYVTKKGLHWPRLYSKEK